MLMYFSVYGIPRPLVAETNSSHIMEYHEILKKKQKKTEGVRRLSYRSEKAEISDRPIEWSCYYR
jgi:hypothetical protein